MKDLADMWWLFALTGLTFSVVAGVAIQKKKYWEGMGFCVLALINIAWTIYLFVV